MQEIVIIGGGVAAAEAALRLRRLLGEHVRLTLISPTGELVIRPLAVLEPFRRGSIPRYPLTQVTAPARARHIRDELARVEPDFGIIITSRGRQIEYDALLIASGAGQSNPYPGPSGRCRSTSWRC